MPSDRSKVFYVPLIIHNGDSFKIKTSLGGLDLGGEQSLKLPEEFRGVLMVYKTYEDAVRDHPNAEIIEITSRSEHVEH